MQGAPGNGSLKQSEHMLWWMEVVAVRTAELLADTAAGLLPLGPCAQCCKGLPDLRALPPSVILTALRDLLPSLLDLCSRAHPESSWWRDPKNSDLRQAWFTQEYLADLIANVRRLLGIPAPVDRSGVSRRHLMDPIGGAAAAAAAADDVGLEGVPACLMGLGGGAGTPVPTLVAAKRAQGADGATHPRDSAAPAAAEVGAASTAGCATQFVGAAAPAAPPAAEATGTAGSATHVMGSPAPAADTVEPANSADDATHLNCSAAPSTAAAQAAGTAGTAAHSTGVGISAAAAASPAAEPIPSMGICGLMGMGTSAAAVASPAAEATPSVGISVLMGVGTSAAAAASPAAEATHLMGMSSLMDPAAGAMQVASPAETAAPSGQAHPADVSDSLGAAAAQDPAAAAHPTGSVGACCISASGTGGSAAAARGMEASPASGLLSTHCPCPSSAAADSASSLLHDTGLRPQLGKRSRLPPRDCSS